MALKSVGKKSGTQLAGSKLGPRIGMDVLEKKGFSPLLNARIKFIL
jgi:hypothetical protein